ncbi:AzlC family ABC transporter permease [Oxalobacter paraformigenes]|uniref:Azaleucine resistance protein AzlC n=1 Tax=Oxalobacter paraformigenes TaxID=556268 RepID=C3X2K7_9BURK|nr:AzlC family ABC transporter permease [Oxalobacter paraformigenes]EEO27443.1 azaleucine resistance protein AzlC [Oxalobacter paraformigenes]
MDHPKQAGEFTRGMKTAFPVMLGFIPFGLVLGAQASQKGFRFFEVPLMTALNFGGGSEFAAVELWTSPPHILVIVLITFLINSRHLLMGAVLSPYLGHLPRKKVLAALFFMCDESWALGLNDAVSRKPDGSIRGFSLPFYMGAALTLYTTWVVCTTLGGMIGPVIGDVKNWGFDMAFPAVFFVLLRGMWRGFAAARPWLISLIVAIAVYLALPGAWYVPVGAAAGLLYAFFTAGRK